MQQAEAEARAVLAVRQQSHMGASSSPGGRQPQRPQVVQPGQGSYPLDRELAYWPELINVEDIGG